MLLEKELFGASKDSNIIVNDKTLSQVSKDLVEFKAIKRDSLYGENSSKISNNPPVVITNTYVVQKHEVYVSNEIRLSLIQDMELLILEDLQNSNEIISCDSSCDVIPVKRFKCYFCSGTVFNLSSRVLSESSLEKGLDFVPFQRKVNELELRRDSEGFCKCMRIN